ncbi:MULTISPECIES: hypothetical protein [Vagococcus]|uniref:Uncharacterized protein n=1 Tax=Vagococcus fluvialis bH819 TaxID=1255619 RepID=A0A1X6WL04_9ENTE|nr:MULTISPECIES: hypothetical protein [Vagococcus]SLM84930.1 hypothetical protein FM121_02465 [Vagococcus fluvialis bH819]HCM90469.1 hypothetical protein [Vagococcus sp.]
MIEMPELFERHMILGKQSFEENEYEVAREHFEEAYNLKDDIKANVYLTKSLMALELYYEAYQVMSEKKAEFLLKEEYQEIYFNLLVKTKLLLEIEKFLIVTPSFKKTEWEKKYKVTKEYELTINERKILENEKELADISNVTPVRQPEFLKKIYYLPKERFMELAKNMLLDNKISFLIKSELINQLTQLDINEPFNTVTWDGKIRTFIPNHHLPLKKMYEENQVLNQIIEYFENSDPSLKEVVTSEVKLHLGCLYPFEIEEMQPAEKWVDSYLKKSEYSFEKEAVKEDLKEILSQQQKIEEQVMNSLLFHE